jgi:hypothetical protein
MKDFSLKIRRFLSGNSFQVAFTFLVSGFLAGAFFNWLTHTSALREFFFVPYTARQARFSWYAASSLILALGLVAGFLVSSRKIDFWEKLRLSAQSSLSAFALVCASVPLLYLSSGDYAARLLRKHSLILLMWFAFPPVIALAMCVLTKSWRLLPVAFLASVIFAAVGLAMSIPVMLVLFWLLNEPEDFILDFVQWTFLYSSLSLCFGSWLLWRVRGK